MGRAAGLRRTPGQLQYDVDVRVVVHRCGARAARRLGGDLPLDDKLDHFARVTGPQILDQNATVGGRCTRPRTVWSYASKYPPYIDTVSIQARTLSRLPLSRACPCSLSQPLIKGRVSAQATYAALRLLASLRQFAP